MAPAESAGLVSVTVTNTDTQTVTLVNSYTFEAAPTYTSIAPVAGALAGGTPVTITGTGFLSGMTVNLGAVACTVTSSTGTQIFCTTGAHAAGSVSISITNTDGQNVAHANVYTYQSAPSLTSISPVGGALGGGTAVSIAGSNFLPGATVTFGGAACSGVTVVSGNQITCVTPSNPAGAVNVVVTNTDSQAGTLTNGYTYEAAPLLSGVAPTGGALALEIPR